MKDYLRVAIPVLIQSHYKSFIEMFPEYPGLLLAPNLNHGRFQAVRAAADERI